MSTRTASHSIVRSIEVTFKSDDGEPVVCRRDERGAWQINGQLYGRQFDLLSAIHEMARACDKGQPFSWEIE